MKIIFFFFTEVQVVAKIAFILTSLSAVHIYNFHIFITIIYSSLVELFTGIAKVMGSNPIQA